MAQGGGLGRERRGGPRHWYTIRVAQIGNQSLAAALAKPVVQASDVGIASRMLVETRVVEKRQQIRVSGLRDSGSGHRRAGIVGSPEIRPRLRNVFRVEAIHQAADPAVGMPYTPQPAVVLKICVLHRIDGGRLVLVIAQVEIPILVLGAD